MDSQNRTALDSLSESIPREHAVIALTWMAARVETMVRERDKAEDFLFGHGGMRLRPVACCDGHETMASLELKAFHAASDDLIAFARSLDSLATGGQS